MPFPRGKLNKVVRFLHENCGAYRKHASTVTFAEIITGAVVGPGQDVDRTCLGLPNGIWGALALPLCAPPHALLSVALPSNEQP
jgi:hypothetical protein